MLKPMPSPRNTNRERLFVLQGRSGVAHDAAPEMGDDPDDNVTAIIAWAKENLEADQLKRLATEINTLAAPDTPANDRALVRPTTGLGSRAPASRGGSKSAEAAFKAAFPGARDIRQL